VPCRLSTI